VEASSQLRRSCCHSVFCDKLYIEQFIQMNASVQSSNGCVKRPTHCLGQVLINVLIVGLNLYYKLCKVFRFAVSWNNRFSLNNLFMSHSSSSLRFGRMKMNGLRKCHAWVVSDMDWCQACHLTANTFLTSAGYVPPTRRCSVDTR